MGRVAVLSSQVANQIAAGEVVDRPASVVKELMENSIDAGAENVTVEISNGGIDLIRVTDDGSGMEEDDARACFLRHATSKISTEEDLRGILTLGFRGEALAAISSVSRVTLITRTRDRDWGVKVVVEAGEVVSCEEAGCPVGTSISVEKLFYNTPARMKFLKKNATEANYAAAAAGRIALSHPETAVKFVKNGRVSMSTPGDGKLKSAVYGVCGRVFTASLIGMPPAENQALIAGTVTVWGYVTKPELSLASRGNQYFILNGRHIRSRVMGAALEEAYRGSMMKGKYPGCVMQAAIDPEFVDVNVHPAKTEVKFQDERAAFKAVYIAVKNALAGAERPVFTPESQTRGEDAPPVEQVEFVKPSQPRIYEIPAEPPSQGVLSQNAPVYEALKTFSGIAASKTYPAPDVNADDFSVPVDSEKEEPKEDEVRSQAPPTPVFDSAAPEFRIAGELFDTYIVVELKDEVMYIDKHAAHERIIYNSIKKSDEPPASQILLEPAVLPVSREDMMMLEERRDELAAAGLEFEDFGGGSIAVREVPPYIDADGIAAFIADVCGRMKRGEKDGIRENILHSIACRAAVKAGNKSGMAELQALTARVLTDPEVRYCPHGRPVAAVMTRKDFEKGFRRIV